MTMLNGKYRITTPTMAIFPEEGRGVARPLRTGSIITVENVEGTTLSVVTWEGQKILMFPQDIEARGVKIEEDVKETKSQFTECPNGHGITLEIVVNTPSFIQMIKCPSCQAKRAAVLGEIRSISPGDASRPIT